MIEIESEIFNVINTAVREKHISVFVTGEYVKSPPSFPCVSVVETDNTCYQKTQTSSNSENHSVLLYEVNVYSNKVKGKKTECKEIMRTIDYHMLKLGFSRIMITPIPNEMDATIYRIVARYKGVVSKNKTIYRR